MQSVSKAVLNKKNPNPQTKNQTGEFSVDLLDILLFHRELFICLLLISISFGESAGGLSANW